MLLTVLTLKKLVPGYDLCSASSACNNIVASVCTRLSWVQTIITVQLYNTVQHYSTADPHHPHTFLFSFSTPKFLKYFHSMHS